MALSVTGLDANGRITPKGTNVIIPPQNAGIGDLVYKRTSYFTNAAYNTPDYFKVVGRGTANNSVITEPNTSVSYTLYGCIYGFVAGMAMVCAPSETSAYWASSGYPSVSDLPMYGGNTVLMRNGNKCTYAQMNTARQSSSDSYRGTAGDYVHPTASYNGEVMTKSTFESGTSANDVEARKIYGTWIEYLRQTLRVNGAPGTPFGITTTGVKVHEFGRWMTKTVHARSSTLFPAINYCYGFCEGSGTWWLPSMFEMAEMMIDENYDKINENGLTGWTDLSSSSDRWSCVLYSGSGAWFYDNYGLSNRLGFSGSQLAVRPVTLLKLV